MIKSELDGQHIEYRDLSKLTHTGVVVGQSFDRATLYVKADGKRSHATADGYDWSIKRVALDRARVGSIVEHIEQVD